MNPSAATLTALLQAGDASAAALGSPGGRTLTFGALRSLIARTVETLAARGIGPNDRVALVTLPIAASSATTSAPCGGT